MTFHSRFHAVSSYFELARDDSFWKPQTEEEVEYYSGDGTELLRNMDRKVIEYVRKCKGIWAENLEPKDEWVDACIDDMAKTGPWTKIYLVQQM